MYFCISDSCRLSPTLDPPKANPARARFAFAFLRPNKFLACHRCAFSLQERIISSCVKKHKNPILEKLADLLALRTHSEFELSEKLLHKSYSEREEVSLALEEARVNASGSKTPKELSDRTARKLHAKNKSYAYITAYLEQRHLPPPRLERRIGARKGSFFSGKASFT